MSKTHVPNAQGKAVGQAHKSGAASDSRRSREPKPKQADKKSSPNRDTRLAPDEARSGPRVPYPPKADVPRPQAARGDDDLMSQPQPFPPNVTTAND